MSKLLPAIGIIGGQGGFNPFNLQNRFWTELGTHSALCQLIPFQKSSFSPHLCPDGTCPSHHQLCAQKSAGLCSIPWCVCGHPDTGRARLKAADLGMHPAGIPTVPSQVMCTALPCSVQSVNIKVFPFQLKAQSQGSSEELRCLQLINQQQEGSNLEELISNQSCLKLANTIKAYVATVSLGLLAAGLGRVGYMKGELPFACLPQFPHPLQRWVTEAQSKQDSMPNPLHRGDGKVQRHSMKEHIESLEG